MPDVTLAPDRTRERGRQGGEPTDDSWFTDLFEETEELQWPHSVLTYNRMRRQSAQIAAVNRAWQLPILATPWYVKQGPARREVAVQLARDLGVALLEDDGSVNAEDTRPARRRGRFSWTDHVRHALLSKVYGHMPFEQVYQYLKRSEGGDGLAHLRKLAPRMPQTITHWEVASDGGLKWIEQARPWGQVVDVQTLLEPIKLPVDRLVVYVNEKEGANWYGTSILRPVYMPYMAKDKLYRLSLVTAERAMGTAIYEASEGAGQEELDRGLELAKAMRTGEESAHAVPNGAALYYGGIRGSLYDPLPMIQHLSVLESRNMLAQFLNLGDTETGSRALGEAFVGFFGLALQAILTDVQDVAQLHVVEDWVDVNYGTAEPAPELVPGDVAGKPNVMAESLVSLMANGAITYDETLEDWVRKALGAPARSDKGRAPAGTPSPTPTPPPAEEAVSQFAAAEYRAASAPELEARTDFARLDRSWQAMLTKLLATWRGVQGRQIKALLAEVRQLVDDGEIAALGALKATTAEAERELAGHLDDMLSEAVDEAVREARRQGVRIRRPEIVTVRKAIKEQAKALARVLGQGLSEKVAREATRNATPAMKGAEVAKRVSTELDKLTDAYLLDNLGGALTAAQNMGRMRVFATAPPARYYASELLDGRTCSNCSTVDGTEYSDLNEAMAAYPSGGYHACLGGSRCRGTVVAVYEEAAPSQEVAA